MKKIQTPIEIILRAIIVANDKILLCASNDQPPIYYLPGGHLDPGETLEAGLKREIMEEAGVKVRAFKFLGLFENFFRWRGEDHHEINFLYQVTLNIKNPREIKSHESHISLIWLEIEKMKKFKILPFQMHKYLIEYFHKKTA